MNIIAERLKEECGEKAVREYLNARGRARQVRDRVSRYKQENREKWQGFLDAAQALAETGVGLLRGEPQSTTLDRGTTCWAGRLKPFGSLSHRRNAPFSPFASSATLCYIRLGK